MDDFIKDIGERLNGIEKMIGELGRRAAATTGLNDEQRLIALKAISSEYRRD